MHFTERKAGKHNFFFVSFLRLSKFSNLSVPYKRDKCLSQILFLQNNKKNNL